MALTAQTIQRSFVASIIGALIASIPVGYLFAKWKYYQTSGGDALGPPRNATPFAFIAGLIIGGLFGGFVGLLAGLTGSSKPKAALIGSTIGLVLSLLCIFGQNDHFTPPQSLAAWVSSTGNLRDFLSFIPIGLLAGLMSSFANHNAYE